MGTSSSSIGPGGGVRIVPPWVPDVPTPSGDGEAANDGEGQTSPEIPVPVPPLTAPSGRFRSTRINLGTYASSGDMRNLRRAVSNYFKKGYGGKSTSVKRFGGAAQTAGSLYGAFAPGGGAGRSPERDALEAAIRAGESPEKVITAVVEAIRPIDGSQDAEADRKAIADALSELMARFPNADFLNLTAEQLNLLISRYVAINVFGRFFLDVGKTIVERAPSVSTGLARLREAKEYIRETVANSFNKFIRLGSAIDRSRLVSLVVSALRDAIEVFQGYI